MTQMATAGFVAGALTRTSNPKGALNDLFTALGGPLPEYATEDLRDERLTRDQARFLSTVHLASVEGSGEEDETLVKNWFQARAMLVVCSCLSTSSLCEGAGSGGPGAVLLCAAATMPPGFATVSCYCSIFWMTLTDNAKGLAACTP